MNERKALFKMHIFLFLRYKSRSDNDRCTNKRESKTIHLSTSLTTNFLHFSSSSLPWPWWLSPTGLTSLPTGPGLPMSPRPTLPPPTPPSRPTLPPPTSPRPSTPRPRPTATPATSRSLSWSRRMSTQEMAPTTPSSPPRTASTGAVLI